jgi:hypothetical protein
MRKMSNLRHVHGVGLAAEILASGSKVRLRAFGSSMLPSLWPGDILTIESARCQTPVPGDIVLVLLNQRPFIHRVKEKRDCDGRLQWITRGDAVPQDDPPAANAELLGRVTSIERNNRIIVPRRRLSTAARLLAWMLCHWDRFRSICLRLHFYLQPMSRAGSSAGEPRPQGLKPAFSSTLDGAAESRALSKLILKHAAGSLDRQTQEETC